MTSFFPKDDIENLPNERWQYITGYNQKYAISDYGRVKSYKHKTITLLKQSLNNNGYPMVELWKDGKRKHCLIHRLVAQEFVENSNPEVNLIVNHIDTNKNNPFYKNLEWTTQSDNLIKYYQTKAKE